MALQFTNTMGGKKEEFHPLNPPNVGMYTCGPTVYDFAHIGNFRTYIFEDILRRYLIYRGYRVFQVMNLTDVEDKIIRAAQSKGISIFEHTRPYIEAFFEDLDTLRIQRAEVYPKATDHIPEMLEIIRILREKGHTYESEGSIYYRISTFPRYGALSGITPDSVKVGARVDQDEYEKEDARDFVLWKARKEGEHFWQTEYGEGRPGWHIECSAMSRKYLGDTFDIHCGGEDNIFPHHENEIAQSEAATGKPFVKYWLHSRHLMVEGEKMSKSKGNFYTLRDLLQKGHSALAIRYFLLSGYYRVQLNLTEDGLHAAHQAWRRLLDFRRRLVETQDKAPEGPLSEEARAIAEKGLRGFEEHMDDDLNTPQALAEVFDFVRDANRFLDRDAATKADARHFLAILMRTDTVLAVLEEEQKSLDAEIESLIAERQEARKNRNWARADAIRDQLAAQGIVLEDTKDGVRWKRGG
ncbi:MAG TPA: cysteine--tRNA ligase [bacterium]|mgnify:FL=1|nr:cysteine--tRNA ligase [bacterium]HQL64039.1 cysteine--tRNA ligase [bacterium]